MVGISVHQLFSEFTGDVVATASECTKTENKLEGMEHSLVTSLSKPGKPQIRRETVTGLYGARNGGGRGHWGRGRGDPA